MTRKKKVAKKRVTNRKVVNNPFDQPTRRYRRRNPSPMWEGKNYYTLESDLIDGLDAGRDPEEFDAIVERMDSLGWDFYIRKGDPRETWYQIKKYLISEEGRSEDFANGVIQARIKIWLNDFPNQHTYF